jgi:hypothetical protein
MRQRDAYGNVGAWVRPGGYATVFRPLALLADPSPFWATSVYGRLVHRQPLRVAAARSHASSIALNGSESASR